MKTFAKTLIALSVVAGTLALACTSFAGPGPGIPGPGERVPALVRAKSQADESGKTGYALTGASNRERGVREESDSRLRGRTPIAHRRLPGEKR